VPQAGSYSVRTTPGFASEGSSSMNRRLTISRITSRGVKVRACSLVREFRVAANEFLVQVAHLKIRDSVWVQVDLAEAGDDEIEQLRPVQPIDLDGEVNLKAG